MRHHLRLNKACPRGGFSSGQKLVNVESYCRPLPVAGPTFQLSCAEVPEAWLVTRDSWHLNAKFSSLIHMGTPEAYSCTLAVQGSL